VKSPTLGYGEPGDNISHTLHRHLTKWLRYLQNASYACKLCQAYCISEINFYSHYIIPRRTVVFAKVIVAHLFKKFPAQDSMLLLVPIMIQMNRVHTLKFYVWEQFYYRLFMPTSPSGLVRSGFLTKILCAIIHLMRATRFTHLIIIDLIILYFANVNLRSHSLWNCLHSPVMPKHSPQHLVLNLNLCSSLHTKEQLSHPYKTWGKITYLYILIFMSADRRWEDKRFWTEWW